tara:strand:+ start:3446 stop:3967 length:522 start_codon:yes stop_codon:yes gene_type:complete
LLYNSQINKIFLFLYCLFALFYFSSCGFNPLYASNQFSDIRTSSSKIYIEPIKGKIGQHITNSLKERIGGSSDSKSSAYILKVVIFSEKLPVAFKLDRTITRFNFVLDANYTLYERKTSKTLTKGSIRSIAAYSIVLSEFANITAAKDAERRAATDMGQEIGNRISLFFKLSN